MGFVLRTRSKLQMELCIRSTPYRVVVSEIAIASSKIQQNPSVIAARKPLYDSNMDREVLGETLLENSKSLLLPDGQPCCKIMACAMYSCSKTLLYKDQRPERSRSEASSDSPIAVSICAWLSNLKQMLDVMPDEGGWSMVNHPRKKLVHADYMEDCNFYPESFIACAYRYFCKVWRDNFPEIRLRKFCRFTKCIFCVKWRTLATSRKESDSTR